MFERYTDRARRAVSLAREEARTLNHNRIGTEHILLGLINEGEGVAAKALESLAISLDAARQQVREIDGQGKLAPSGRIPFTPRAKKVLELSHRESMQSGHNHIGTEHLLLGLIRENSCVAAQVLVGLGADLDQVRRQVTQLLRSYQGKEPALANAPAVSEMPASAVLDQFGRNLTREASNGKLDPVIGRDKEIERVMQVLSLDTKNNPVLVGLTKSCATAVVEGLAQKIAEGDIPARLQGKQLYTFHPGPLVGSGRAESAHEAGLRFPPFQVMAALGLREHEEKIASVQLEKESAINAQDFDKAAALEDTEKKLLIGKTSLETHCKLSDFDVMAAIITEVRIRDDIILFIDELSAVVSEDTKGSSSDFSSILKPALTSGELQIIGATTPEEFRRNMEADEALRARLQLIPIAEPTLLYSNEMLKIALRAATRARIPGGH